MSIKYEKQILELLEARNNQQTARKVCSDYVVNWYANKLDLT